MKRTAGYLLVALGACLLISAPLLRFYTLPQIEKTPLNFYFVERASGVGSYLDPATLHFHHGEVDVIRTIKGDPSAGGDTYATWNVYTQTQGDIGNVIDITNDRWRFQRHTGESAPEAGAQLPYSGQWLRYPFNTEKKTYEFWDSTAHHSYPARFTGETQVLGHTVYQFTTVVPPTKLQTLTVPGGIVGQPDKPTVQVDLYYANPSYVVDVDPRTGTEVAGSSHKVETLRLAGTSTALATVLDVTLVPTPATTAGLMKKATDGQNKLDLVGTWLPIAALLLGAIALLGAFLLSRRPEEQEPEIPLQPIRLPDGTATRATNVTPNVPAQRPAQHIEIGEKTDSGPTAT